MMNSSEIWGQNNYLILLAGLWGIFLSSRSRLHTPSFLYVSGAGKLVFPSTAPLSLLISSFVVICGAMTIFFTSVAPFHLITSPSNTNCGARAIFFSSTAPPPLPSPFLDYERGWKSYFPHHFNAKKSDAAYISIYLHHFYYSQYEQYDFSTLASSPLTDFQKTYPDI